MKPSLKEKVRHLKILVKKDISQKGRFILFGSYAKGLERKWSDIDVAVVVPSIKDPFQKEVDLRLKSLSIDEKINPLIFTEEEFSQNSPLVWEIKKHGIPL